MLLALKKITSGTLINNIRKTLHIKYQSLIEVHLSSIVPGKIPLVIDDKIADNVSG